MLYILFYSYFIWRCNKKRDRPIPISRYRWVFYIDIAFFSVFAFIFALHLFLCCLLRCPYAKPKLRSWYVTTSFKWFWVCSYRFIWFLAGWGFLFVLIRRFLTIVRLIFFFAAAACVFDLFPLSIFASIALMFDFDLNENNKKKTCLHFWAAYPNVQCTLSIQGLHLCLNLASSNSCAVYSVKASIKSWS